MYTQHAFAHIVFYSMGKNNSPLDTKKSVFLHSKIEYFEWLADSVSCLMHQ